jgi:cobalt-zinc-cadmium efflux system membrane fusion protein
MNKLRIKNLLLAGVAVLALTGGVIGWNYVVSPSLAAEGHGDSHGHEEGEEKHDEGKEEQHGHGHEDEHGHGGGKEEGEHAEGVIPLSAEQIAAAGIKVAAVGPGQLAREVSVPGKVVAAADRMAQIVPKVGGTVTEARKNLGDTVEKGRNISLD